jgi:hypothetical protein
MISNFIYNKIFFKNLRKAMKNLFHAIQNADKNYIEVNQENIINEVNEIAEKIRKGE